jgi:glycine/D-amino acid oxidase-like deaminating enzyme
MLIETDMIIIGYGIFGLTTAYGLLQKDSSIKILVLEAKGSFFLLRLVLL